MKTAPKPEKPIAHKSKKRFSAGLDDNVCQQTEASARMGGHMTYKLSSSDLADQSSNISENTIRTGMDRRLL